LFAQISIGRIQRIKSKFIRIAVPDVDVLNAYSLDSIAPTFLIYAKLLR